ncbi:MAG: ATP-binding protein [Chitinophagales bacterium]
MKKTISIFFLILSIFFHLSAQISYTDSLVELLAKTDSDTARYVILQSIAYNYGESHFDSTYYYGERAAGMARKLNMKLNEAVSLMTVAYALLNSGNYPRSLQYFHRALEIAEDPANENSHIPISYFKPYLGPRYYEEDFLKEILIDMHQLTGVLYENTKEYDKEVDQINLALQYAKELNDSSQIAGLYNVMGRIYYLKQKPDSGLIFQRIVLAYSGERNIDQYAGHFLNIGKCYHALGKLDSAKKYLRKALESSILISYPRGAVASELLLADICKRERKSDSALYFAIDALHVANQVKVPDLMLRSYAELSDLYISTKKYDSASKYQALIIKINDSLFNRKQIQEFSNVDFDDQLKRQELEAARKAYRERIRTYGLIAGLVVFLTIAGILWRNNQNRKKAYFLLKKQKAETDFLKAKAEETLEELKTTQSQLIQREKMASLGEITAGIAHEIQNPLNFVNNFSEVNRELLSELKAGPIRKLEGPEKAEATAIIDDLTINLGKIDQHGKRADAIVKNMLLHSVSGSSQKEPTDINALAEEYLRLSYHGFRSKEKSLLATLETSLDESIDKINIVEQDIGRVLLNLYNNAFYSVNEKLSMSSADYIPTVRLKTSKTDGFVKISIIDNGMGIPKNKMDKIFQPFYTSKPSGQGTGLGLSLSYDIITKEHQGTISVDSREGEFAEFNIRLPVN